MVAIRAVDQLLNGAAQLIVSRKILGASEKISCGQAREVFCASLYCHKSNPPASCLRSGTLARVGAFWATPPADFPDTISTGKLAQLPTHEVAEHNPRR